MKSTFTPPLRTEKIGFIEVAIHRILKPRASRTYADSIKRQDVGEIHDASPAAQRRILREAKYPDEDEPRAMRLYYQEACDTVQAFYRGKHQPAWLAAKADQLAQLAAITPGPGANRLRNNSRGVRQYLSNFSGRDFKLGGSLRLSIQFDDVRVAVTPDLNVVESGKQKIIKLDFSKEIPDSAMVKIISQVMFEASRGRLRDQSSRSVLYLDVARGVEHRGARAGARTLRDVEAACQTIATVWDSIEPSHR